MTDKDIREMTDAVMMSVGIIQGAYQRFLQENDGEIGIALELTRILWDGIMLGKNMNDDDERWDLL